MQIKWLQISYFYTMLNILTYVRLFSWWFQFFGFPIIPRWSSELFFNSHFNIVHYFTSLVRYYYLLVFRFKYHKSRWNDSIHCLTDIMLLVDDWTVSIDLNSSYCFCILLSFFMQIFTFCYFVIVADKFILT